MINTIDRYRDLRSISRTGARRHMTKRHLPEQIAGAQVRQRSRSVDPFRRYREVLQSLPDTDDVQRMLWTDANICCRIPFRELRQADYGRLGTRTAYPVNA